VPKIAKKNKDKKDKKNKKKRRDSIEAGDMQDEFEFEVLWDPERNCWSTDLVKGKYLVNVNAPGHPEFNTYIEVKKGHRDFTVIVPQNSATHYTVKVNAINV